MAAFARSLSKRDPGSWADTVNDAFFPVETKALGGDVFNAHLKIWTCGDLALSVHSCDPVCYRRDKSHISRGGGDELLITFPVSGKLRFSQDQANLVCDPGMFFLELGSKAYEFIQDTPGEMWSIKLPVSKLNHGLRSIERYTPYSFGADVGAGGLLYDVVRSTPARLTSSDDAEARGIQRVIIDLLLLALEADQRVLGSELTSIKKGHLMRIELFVRRNLRDPSLTPELIASACGISPRYLHGLFQSTGTSVGRWILEQRLMACHEDLGHGPRRGSVAEIAFRWGFSDHAHFSRHYKRRFGQTPRERRLSALCRAGATSPTLSQGSPETSDGRSVCG